MVSVASEFAAVTCVFPAFVLVADCLLAVDFVLRFGVRAFDFDADVLAASGFDAFCSPVSLVFAALFAEAVSVCGAVVPFAAVKMAFGSGFVGVVG